MQSDSISLAIEKEERKVRFFGAICNDVLQYERNILQKHIVPYPFLKKQLKRIHTKILVIKK